MSSKFYGTWQAYFLVISSFYNKYVAEQRRPEASLVSAIDRTSISNSSKWAREQSCQTRHYRVEPPVDRSIVIHIHGEKWSNTYDYTDYEFGFPTRTAYEKDYIFLFICSTQKILFLINLSPVILIPITCLIHRNCFVFHTI